MLHLRFTRKAHQPFNSHLGVKKYDSWLRHYRSSIVWNIFNNNTIRSDLCAITHITPCQDFATRAKKNIASNPSATMRYGDLLKNNYIFANDNIVPDKNTGRPVRK